MLYRTDRSGAEAAAHDLRMTALPWQKPHGYMRFARMESCATDSGRWRINAPRGSSGMLQGNTNFRVLQGSISLSPGDIR
jgi:hypothetical protein